MQSAKPEKDFAIDTPNRQFSPVVGRRTWPLKWWGADILQQIRLFNFHSLVNGPQLIAAKRTQRSLTARAADHASHDKSIIYRMLLRLHSNFIIA
jgi:hypothetical protein